MDVAIDQIRPSPYQPRLYFDLEPIKESIKQDGMLVIPLVRKKPDGKTEYELIDGERRWRAIKELGWNMIQVQIKDIDDETTRRMVYILNEERQPYTLEENTKFFRRMYEEMGSVNAVAQAFGRHNSTVWQYINVSMLPEPLQKAVWAGKVTTGYIQEMEPLFTEARNEFGTDWFRYTEIELRKSSTYQRIVAICEQIYTEQIRSPKEMRKEYVDPYLEMLDKKRIERAKEEIEKIVPRHLVEAKEVRLETPEELERTAEVLRKEAKRKREEALTPEKKAEERRIKEEKRRKSEEARKRRGEEEKKRIEEEAKRRIEQEAKEKAKSELLEDPGFIRKLAEKEYAKQKPFDIESPLQTMDLEDVVMQKLGTSIPTDKIPRAEEIIREEIRSLQKRLEIFPEKSAKIEPKFEYLKLMEERGVIPYTIWDFQYRDDYAGDKDFHGNCSPQVVEQCIWRFTNERDLVLDPMAGSGTTMDVCKRYNRKCVGYDLKPPSNRTDIIRNDSRKIPLDNESIDMIFIHPPYWNLTYFTKAEEGLPDLSRAKTPEEFLHMLKQVFQECYRTLKRGKFMCVLLGDLIRDGRFIPLCREATSVAEEIGFIDYGYAIKLAHGEVSRKKSGVIIAEPIYTKNLKISHDLVMFFRKPELRGN